MTDNPNPMRQAIKNLFEDWSFLVTHYGWKFNVNYCEKFADMPRDANENTQALTYANFRYLKAEIYINLEVCAQNHDHDNLREVVVHELTHLLLSPIDSTYVDEDKLEYVVTTLTRCMIGLRKASDDRT